ncbi:MAG: hypothetical protein AB7N76_27690 [Planctomycetota bacterium]
MPDLPATPTRIYKSSRFSSGNMFFPDRLVLEADRVLFKKSHLIGGEEESIRYEQIASVSVQSGVLFANLLFESTGGTEPVYMNGLWRGTATAAKADLMARIRAHTTGRKDPVLEALERQTEVLEQILAELRKR